MAQEFEKLPQLTDVRNSVKRNGSYATRSLSQIKDIARHHSGTNTGTAFSFANWHVDHNGWPSIGYHFVILRDGPIQWCNGLDRVSWHVGNNNTPLIGVCLVGNGSFTEAQEKSFRELVEALRKTDGVIVSLDNVKGHNEYPGHASNACPGISMNDVRAALKSSKPAEHVSKPREPATNPTLLRNGDRGSKVTELQRKLMAAGFDLPQWGADGVFGDETEKALRDFQKTTGILVDGIFGPQSKQALESYEKPREISGTFSQKSASEKHAVINDIVNVYHLQNLLLAVGESLPQWGADGVAGAETLAAIESYQRKNGLSSSGNDNYGRPGPQTMRRLNSTVSYVGILSATPSFSRGTAVRHIQRVVGADADGVYGPKTRDAVRAYQRANGLAVDGVVGEQTWGHLFGQ